MWPCGGTRRKRKLDLVFLGCRFEILRSLLQNQKPLKPALLTERKAVPYPS